MNLKCLESKQTCSREFIYIYILQGGVNSKQEKV